MFEEYLSEMFFSSPPPLLPAAAGDCAVAWTRGEDKVFENALVRYSEDTPERWLKIAALLPGKSPRDVMEHYGALLQDVMDIESGRIDLVFRDDQDGAADLDSPSGRGRNLLRSKGKEERKKGIPWTEEEHRRFLDGLERFGKGDWRSISRNAVVTRTPTQVASHAQKYFIRLNSSGKKEKKRGSIHDITNSS